MYDPIHPAFYHFWSSALVGSLGLAWIYLISSPSSSTDQRGCISWMSSRQLLLLLLLSVWIHIPADIVEHGYGPRTVEGVTGLLRWLF